MIKNNQSGPMCTRCRNHGEPFVRLKGHRKNCPWRNCVCEMCILITQRGGSNREKAKLMEESITVKKRPGRPTVKIQRDKEKKHSKDDKKSEDFNPETVGYKTKYKRKSKPKKLIPMSPKPNYSYTMAHQEATSPPLQGLSFRSPTLQFRPTYQDPNLNTSQHIILNKDSPTSYYRPAARPPVGLMGLPLSPPENDHLQVDEGYFTPYRSFPNLFNEESQVLPHYSLKPAPYDREFESGQLQELQVSPQFLHAPDGRCKAAMSCMHLNENQGFSAVKNGGVFSTQRRPVSSASSIISSNVKSASQTVHWTYTPLSHPELMDNK